MIFLPKYEHSNGLKLSGALEEFSITSHFLGSNSNSKLDIEILNHGHLGARSESLSVFA